MDAHKHRTTADPLQPLGGPRRDVERLRRDGAATIAEIREFVAQMHGKDPQEVLGLVATSGLFLNLVLSTVLMSALVAVLTVVPYLWTNYASAEQPAPKKAPAAATATAAPAKAGDAAAPANPAAPQDGTKSGGTGEPTAADARAVAKKLGEDGVKGAPGDKSEPSLDSLIDLKLK